MAATKNNSLPVRTFGGCTSDGEVAGSLFDSDATDLARASESCREYYAAIGTFGESWCEEWNGETWFHWRDQADGIYDQAEEPFMEKMNIKTLTEWQARLLADIVAIAPQREGGAQ